MPAKGAVKRQDACTFDEIGDISTYNNPAFLKECSPERSEDFQLAHAPRSVNPIHTGMLDNAPLCVYPHINEPEYKKTVDRDVQ